MLEKSVNQYGQEQEINNAGRIIKIDGRLLQVRLIRTRKWKGMNCVGGKFSEPMPRARFVRQKEENPYYLVRKSDLDKMRRERWKVKQ